MEKIYDVLILGSGPAGLTAGIYSVRAGLLTLLISGSSPGGQLTQTTLVENFPGFTDGVMGPVLMDNMRKQALKLGVSEITGIVERIDFSQKPFRVWAGEEEYQGKSVIIATGTETKWLEIPSEAKFIGHGVSSCATCDGFFFKDKKIVVVGGGDTAFEEAIFLTKFASSVTIIHRRDKFRASNIMQERAKANPKISFVLNSVVDEILGAEKVIGIKTKNTISGEITEIQTDGVFVAIGHIPQTEIFKEAIERDEKGYIKIGHTANGTRHTLYKMMTSVPGVFAAGDVHDHIYKQAITAAGFGCMAALEAEKWLSEQK